MMLRFFQIFTLQFTWPCELVRIYYDEMLNTSIMPGPRARSSWA